MPLVSCIRVVPGCQGSGSGGTGEEKARVLLFNYTSLNHSFLCCCKSLFLLPHFGKATDFGDKGCSGEGWGKKQKSNHFFFKQDFHACFQLWPLFILSIFDTSESWAFCAFNQLIPSGISEAFKICYQFPDLLLAFKILLKFLVQYVSIVLSIFFLKFIYCHVKAVWGGR